MGIIGDIILGIVQGLAEFLPISSKGHLVLAQKFLGYEVHDLAYDLVLHLATLLAIFVVFRKFLAHLIAQCWISIKERKMNAGMRLALMVAFATVPAGIIGLKFKSFFESLFGNITVLGYGFIWTGLILFLTRRIKSKSINMISDAPDQLLKEFETVSYGKALIVGCFQCLALLPGVSRSGMTIAAGLFAGMTGGAASVFSFMLSIPTILGAAVLKLSEVENLGERLPSYSIGFVASFIFGLIGLKVVLAAVKKNRLELFAAYVWIWAIICLFVM
ncbi:MAG: undecaprenyl-diphosphate phosphatase [Bdellovibrionota bacterium]